MLKPLARLAMFLLPVTFLSSNAVAGLIFNTGSPDGRIGLASRPGTTTEIEAADDFILTLPAFVNSATFIGLLPTGFSLSNVNFVGVEIYHVFPQDSTNPPSGNVPTRVNSPSDNVFDSRDTASGNLTSMGTILNPNFSAANSILNGINKGSNPTTTGEGPISGEEVMFNLTFTTPFLLPAGHYFFVPQVGLNGAGNNFFWLSTTGPPQFTGDLQAWIRNANLDPDWLRAGTDIVGGTAKFDQSFSLTGDIIPEPSTIWLMLAGTSLLAGRFWWSRRRA